MNHKDSKNKYLQKDILNMFFSQHFVQATIDGDALPKFVW